MPGSLLAEHEHPPGGGYAAAERNEPERDPLDPGHDEREADTDHGDAGDSANHRSLREGGQRRLITAVPITIATMPVNATPHPRGCGMKDRPATRRPIPAVSPSAPVTSKNRTLRTRHPLRQAIRR